LGVPHKLGTPALTPRPVINWGQTRQTQGGDVSRTIQQGATLFVGSESASALISWAAPFRDPYSPFFAAIRAQFAVARSSGHGARETHWPATTRAQML